MANYVVSNNLPLSTVETASFRHLLELAFRAPVVHPVPGRLKLMKTIEALADTVEQEKVESLAKHPLHGFTLVTAARSAAMLWT